MLDSTLLSAEPGLANELWSAAEVRDILGLLSRRWVLGILEALRHQAIRRHVLRARLGSVSDKVLTSTLRDMEAAGLVLRTVVVGVPVEVDYGLTPLGASLSEPLGHVAIWCRSHRAFNATPH
jgi:DNA-binding HxlR family transcriptional regulator